MKTLLISAFLFFPVMVFACECIFQENESYYDSAENVFIGKVVSSVNLCEFDPTVKNNDFCFGAKVHIIKPIKVYKHVSDQHTLMKQNSDGKMVPKKESEQEIHRDKQRYATVYISQGLTNCGVGFEDNEEFIIFSKGHGIFQSTTQCNGSGHVSRSKDIIQALDKGAFP